MYRVAILYLHRLINGNELKIMQNRKQYDIEFKKSALDLVFATGRKACEVESELGLFNGAISSWKKELEKYGRAGKSIVTRYKGCRIVNDVITGSLQIFLHKFPPLSARQYLKRNGFEWLADYQCWRCSRYSESAVSLAEHAVDMIARGKEDNSYPDGIQFPRALCVENRLHRGD
jgi:hypothetical protein